VYFHGKLYGFCRNVVGAASAAQVLQAAHLNARLQELIAGLLVLSSAKEIAITGLALNVSVLLH